MKKSASLFIALALLIAMALPAAAAAKIPGYEGKTLNVLLCASTFCESTESFLNEFAELYGITLNYDLLGRSNFDEKIVIELSSSSSAHDVYYVFGESLLQYLDNGWLRPLDGFIADPAVCDPAVLDLEGFSEGPLKACTSPDGQLYGLPVFAATCMMYYRTDYFEQAGITEPPKTWDELVAACEKLKAIGVEPLGMRGNKAFGGSGWHMPMVYLSYGASVYKDFPTDMTPTVNSPEFVEAITFYSNLLNNYGIEGATTCNYEDIILAVQQGNVGIWIDGAPLVAQYENPELSKSSGLIGFSVIPAGPKGVTAAQTTHMLAMNKNAAEPELAYKFIEWCASAPTLTRASVDGYHVAIPRASVMNSPEYLAKNNYGDGQWAETYSQCLSLAHPHYYPLNGDWPEVSDIIASAASEVFTGKDAQAALDDANRKIDRVMRQKGYY